MFPLHILQVSTPNEFTAHSSEHSCEWCTRRPFCFSLGIFFYMSMTDFEQREAITFLSKQNKWMPSTTKQCCKKLRKWCKRREVQIPTVFCTMTALLRTVFSLSNSTSQRKQWLPYPILCTLQTWVHVTFFYFRNLSGQ